MFLLAISLFEILNWVSKRGKRALAIHKERNVTVSTKLYLLEQVDFTLGSQTEDSTSVMFPTLVQVLSSGEQRYHAIIISCSYPGITIIALSQLTISFQNMCTLQFATVPITPSVFYQQYYQLALLLKGDELSNVYIQMLVYKGKILS